MDIYLATELPITSSTVQHRRGTRPRGAKENESDRGYIGILVLTLQT